MEEARTLEIRQHDESASFECIPLIFKRFQLYEVIFDRWSTKILLFLEGGDSSGENSEPETPIAPRRPLKKWHCKVFIVTVRLSGQHGFNVLTSIYFQLNKSKESLYANKWPHFIRMIIYMMHALLEVFKGVRTWSGQAQMWMQLLEVCRTFAAFIFYRSWCYVVFTVFFLFNRNKPSSYCSEK